jgi:alkanesulfonate monooxygenase SsuD/methylene tetrahydromethanopterin reductase-like flavin-dependent oxidoreductase (luciferase family)
VTKAFRQRQLLGPNRLKLGIFGANCSSGLAATLVEERWQATWENNVALAELADNAGIEFMLPIARWRGYGGATDFQHATLETITWACGLLASTQRLCVFGTVHVPLVHPIFAAKQFVTTDLVSRGRFGINLVCGWNQDEFDMFGAAQREHDVRYDYADEWLSIVEGLWSNRKPFDFSSRYFKLNNVVGDPKPFNDTRPILMNAAASSAGRMFSVRHSDVLFTTLLDLESASKQVNDIKVFARQNGNDRLEVFTHVYVVCRGTRREAEDYHHHYAIDRADWTAVDRLAAMQGLHTQGRPPELRDKLKFRIAGGHGGLPIIGDPDDVAAKLQQVADAGFAGCTITFVNYLSEFPFFEERVLPRLERAGLRYPTSVLHES